MVLGRAGSASCQWRWAREWVGSTPLGSTNFRVQCIMKLAISRSLHLYACLLLYLKLHETEFCKSYHCLIENLHGFLAWCLVEVSLTSKSQFDLGLFLATSSRIIINSSWLSVGLCLHIDMLFEGLPLHPTGYDGQHGQCLLNYAQCLAYEKHTQKKITPAGSASRPLCLQFDRNVLSTQTDCKQQYMGSEKLIVSLRSPPLFPACEKLETKIIIRYACAEAELAICSLLLKALLYCCN